MIRIFADQLQFFLQHPPLVPQQQFTHDVHIIADDLKMYFSASAMLFHVLQVFDNLENCHVDLHPVDAVLGSPPEN